MRGSISIKGNLFTNDSMDSSLLKEEGITINVREDVFFYVKKGDLTLGPDDVYIEDLFSKLDIKDIIAFSPNA